MDEQLKTPFITQYSKDNWSIYKTMVLAYADVIDATEFLLSHAEPPEDTAAKAIWNKKTVNLHFQLLRSLGNNSNYIIPTSFGRNSWIRMSPLLVQTF